MFTQVDGLACAQDKKTIASKVPNFVIILIPPGYVIRFCAKTDKVFASTIARLVESRSI
jgi:hypothetical protein